MIKALKSLLNWFRAVRNHDGMADEFRRSIAL